MRNQHCEVLLFHVLDPAELDFNFEGAQHFQEMESSKRIELSPELVRKAYLAKINDHLEATRTVCAQNSCEYLLLRTDVSPLQALGSYLAKRKVMQ
jgi:hypothetical protein